jgi:uncharacterized protein (DUF2252 family)
MRNSYFPVRTHQRRPFSNIRPPVRAHNLAALRQIKMAGDAHAYVRGSTAYFYTRLSESKCEIPQGPAVWICGDCHLGNLGPLAGEKGDVRVEIRDLDQTVHRNPAHDIIRLGLSLACAARGSNLSGLTITHMLESLIAGYRRGLSGNIGAMERQGGRSDIISRSLPDPSSGVGTISPLSGCNPINPLFLLGEVFGL